MHILVKTHSLYLRRFTPEDALLILDLNADPAVTQYTHDPVRDIVHAEEILSKAILPQYERGLGRWAVHLAADDSFIGWCGLKYRPELDEVDLGYRYHKAYWGKGYATEAARASLDFGFREARLQRIVGRAEHANKGSLKVLENCGMRYVCDEEVDGFPVRTYEALAVNYLNEL